MITNSWVRITAWAAGLVAIAALLHIVQILYRPMIAPVLDVLAPLSIALAIALLLDPTIDRLQKRGLSRGAAVGLVALLFLAFLVLLVSILMPILIRQAGELSKNVPEYWQKAEKSINGWMLDNKGLLKRTNLPTTLQGFSDRYSKQIQTFATASFSRFTGLLQGLVGKAIWLVLIPVVSIFLLLDLDRIKKKALLLSPQRYRSQTAELANSIGKVFGAYIRGLLIVACLYGILCGTIIKLYGVPYAVMLGVAAGILSLIPYVGALTTVILASLVAYVSTGNPSIAFWLAVTIVVANQISDMWITPKIVGKAVGLHPVLAIIALLIGGSLFQFTGMIIAVPVAASIQIVVLEFYPPLKGPEQEARVKKPSLLAKLLFRRKEQE
jgi:predicted PurR-regulated permease PerM